MMFAAVNIILVFYNGHRVAEKLLQILKLIFLYRRLFFVKLLCFWIPYKISSLLLSVIGKCIILKQAEAILSIYCSFLLYVISVDLINCFNLYKVLNC